MYFSIAVRADYCGGCLKLQTGLVRSGIHLVVVRYVWKSRPMFRAAMICGVVNADAEPLLFLQRWIFLLRERIFFLQLALSFFLFLLFLCQFLLSLLE